MKPRLPAPRLLPVTICMMALVLTMKSVLLVRAVLTDGARAALIGAAEAASEPAHETKQAKPAGHGPEKKSPPPEPPKAEEKPAEPAGPPPMTDSEKAVLLDLRERRTQLETRESALNTRESEAAAAEQKLSARVAELQGLQKQLEALDAQRGEREENAWKGLVKVYETMKPREAAVIFNDLAMPVLIAVLDRMKDAKAAAILAAMSPDKARDVTTQLALSRTRAAASVAAGGAPARTPGG